MCYTGVPAQAESVHQNHMLGRCSNVCANTVTSPFLIFIGLASIVENLDVITESMMLGRVLLHSVG